MKVFVRKNVFDTKIEELLKKIRMLKVKFSTFESKTGDMEDFIKKTVEAETKRFFTEKIVEAVNEEMRLRIKGMSKRIMLKVESGYVDSLNKNIRSVARAVIGRNIRFESKAYKLNNCPLSKIKELYEAGWKTIYIGKLKENGDMMVLLDRPLLNSIEESKSFWEKRRDKENLEKERKLKKEEVE
jgi:hypothetical protein